MDYPQLRCSREAYVQFRFGISPILVHRLRYRKDVLPRNLLCPVCKSETEDEEHVLFVCNAYNEFRRDVQVLMKRHTAYHSDVSFIMSANDEESVTQLSRYLYRVFKKKPRICDCLKNEERMKHTFRPFEVEK